MIEILIIIISIVYIWEHSGFIYDMNKLIYNKLNKGKQYKGQPIMKPFGCYICMIMWITSIYFYTQIEHNIIYSIGIGVLSSIVGMIVDKILMIILRLINKIS